MNEDGTNGGSTIPPEQDNAEGTDNIFERFIKWLFRSTTKYKVDQSIDVVYPRFPPKVEFLILIIAVYTLVLGIALAYVAYSVYNQKMDSFLKLLIYVGCAGGIGGTVYSAQGLIQHYIDKNFITDYRYWYFFRPFMSIAVSAVFTLFVICGLISLTGASVDTIFIVNANDRMATNSTTAVMIPDFNQPLIVNKAMFFCALAFIAGYSTTTFLKRMNAVIDTLLGDMTKEDKENKEAIIKLEKELKASQDRIAELEKAKQQTEPIKVPVVEPNKPENK